ncbi:MAG: DUF29 domain-containing protein [Candidatus Magnetoovum sp. WYHC-5]|nr:DUF29 domain-containing protein [Candidatus Magnetoovum sp. WYHC-5]
MDNQLTLIDSDKATGQSLYERDFYQWAIHNVNLIRQGRFTEIDLENVAEELEDMGRNKKNEIASRLLVLIIHLLKWQYEPQMRSTSWASTINTQRAEIERVLEDSPSLKYNIEVVIEKEFKRAKSGFERETSISKKILPEICPYTFEQLSDYDFWPE